jgi:uncharacterized protein (TIGR02996 family)
MRPMILDDTGRALIRAVAAAPLDDAPRLIFADWLDERGGDAVEFWARLIRGQVEMARYKRENESHLPTDPSKATRADLGRVVPRTAAIELGIAGKLTSFIDCLPGWPVPHGDAEITRFDSYSPFRGVGLTNDLVCFSGFHSHYDALFWRGFPVLIDTKLAKGLNHETLRGLQATVPTFLIYTVEPDGFGLRLVVHPDPGVCDLGFFESRLVTATWARRRTRNAKYTLYWEPGNSLAPKQERPWPWPYSPKSKKARGDRPVRVPARWPIADLPGGPFRPPATAAGPGLPV